MAIKKKRKTTKNKQSGSKKLIKPKRAASAKRTARKPLAAKKSAAKKPAARTKGATKAKAAVSKKNRKKTSGIKSARAATRRAPKRNSNWTDASLRTGFESDSAGQSGDLQGLSNVERADSESVDELIDEGNAFEAGVVSGVEEADDEDGREVHTHEVPEDDVPGEYLDED
jgi:hypothetical protein